MANFLYHAALQAFGRGQINWETGTVRAQLVDKEIYEANPGHAFLSSVDLGARLGAPQDILNRTMGSGGVADGDDVVVTGLGESDSPGAVVIYKDTGTESTSSLLVYLDSNGDGDPLVFEEPLGGVLVVQWSDGPDKIFRL